jgi:PAS domain S-box-containing protein
MVGRYLPAALHDSATVVDLCPQVAEEHFYMGNHSTDDPSIDHVLAGTPQMVGSFRFYADQQRWEWSDEVAAIHGYGPGEVSPTTQLLLAHKHPEDRERVAMAIDELLRNGKPFSSRHRIVDRGGRVRHVLVVGDRMLDESGSVAGTEGFYVDLSDVHASELKETMDAAVKNFAASRAVIEQAKGMLMLVYGISPDRAFDVLTWRSQQTNTKLRTLAQNLVNAATKIVTIDDTARQSFDHLLLTAHQGETPAAAAG